MIFLPKDEKKVTNSIYRWKLIMATSKDYKDFILEQLDLPSKN